MNNANNNENKAKTLASLSAAEQENWEAVWTGSSAYASSGSMTVPGLGTDTDVRITATVEFAVYNLDPYNNYEQSYTDTVTLTNAVLPTSAYSNNGRVGFTQDGNKVSFVFHPYEEEFKGYVSSSTPTRVTITKVEHAVPPAVVTDDPECVDYRQSYVEGSAGNAGAYKVNTRTGRVDFTKELFALGGERMPMGMSLSHNPYISGGAYATQMPTGWKLNYQQYVYLDGTDYKYIDGNYRRHTFKPLAGTGRYYDTAHTGLLLTVSGSTATITDDRTNTLTFTGGKLTRVAERNGSTETATTIAYTSSEMTVTDGMGRTSTVTFGTNAVTVKRPDEKVITLNVAGGKLTGIEEVANEGKTPERHAYTYDADGRLMSAQAGYITDNVFTCKSKADFAYNGAGKVTQIDESVNGNATLRYVMRYNAGNTTVEMTKYPTSNSVITRSTVYAYATNGETTGTYEKKDGKFAGVRFRSQEDFARYTVYVSEEQPSTVLISHYPIMDSDIGESMEITPNEEYSLVLSSESVVENRVLSILVTPNVSKSAKECSNIKLAFYDSQGRITGRASATVYRDDGAQTLAFRVPKEVYTQNIPEVGLIADDGVTFTVSDMRVNNNFAGAEFDCVNFGPSGVVDYDEPTSAGVNTWHIVCECRVGSGAEKVKMTKNDWLTTLENRDRANGGSFVLWYGDLSGALTVNSTTGITMVSGALEASRSLGEIKYATMTQSPTRQMFEYNAYGTGDNYVVTTKNTVFEDGTNKACTLHYDQYYRPVKTEDSEGAVTTYTYDTYGNMTREKITADGKSIIYDSVYGDENGAASGGKYLVEEKDYLGDKTNIRKYRYNAVTGDVSSEISPEDLTTDYAYTHSGDPASIKATVDNAENSHVFNYDAKGRLNKVDYNGMSYVLTYDDKYNEVTEVTAQYKQGGGTYIDTLLIKGYTHSVNEDYVKTTTGQYEYTERTYDAYGRPIVIDDVSFGGSASRTDIYGAPTDDVTNITDAKASSLTRNADSKLRKRIDNDRSAVYTYNSKGKVTKIERTDGLTLESVYDDSGRQSGEFVRLNGATQTLSLTYEDGDAMRDDRVTKSTLISPNYTVKTTDAYDGFGRLKARGREFNATDIPLTVELIDGYEYASGSGSGTTTEKPATVTHTLNLSGSTQAVTLPTESFGYDKDGNITTIARSDGAVRYEYDKLGRLTREDNERLGKTWTYAYDAGGNITAKKEYAYTLDSLGSVTKDYEIGYDSIRKDNLKTFDKKSFEYSKNDGFPTTYKGVSLTWYSRRLYEYGSTEFTYDADNVRRTKKANGTTTTYYYDGSRLLAEKRGTKVIRYMYDHSGLTGIVIDGAPYIYLKNALGDITGIYNDFGAKVASYAYDAWGNCTVYTASGALDENASSIGNTNPFRYRGYYYDVETKLYYLINRYYDPEVGRFISPDHIGYMLEQMDRLNGCNLYAYCLNNPVMEIDPEGLIVGFDDAVYAVVGLIIIIFGLAMLPKPDFGAFNVNTNDIGKKVPDKTPEIGSLETPSDDIISKQNEFPNITEFKPHTKNPSPSKKNKHEKGAAANKRNKKGGEKGDERRPLDLSNKRHKMIYIKGIDWLIRLLLS